MNATVPSEIQADLDFALSKLEKGAQNLQSMPLLQRRQLIQSCAANIPDFAQQWVEVTCAAKQIS
ncbi:hypothetical protein N9B60_07225, partial [Mariniblastus sp.]|nr:hypothetical protein [Mariniblastus sp.]